VSKDDLPEQQIRSLGPVFYRTAVGTAVVAGLFCAVVAASLGRAVVVRTRLDTVEQSRALDGSEVQTLLSGRPLPAGRRLALLQAILAGSPDNAELHQKFKVLRAGRSDEQLTADIRAHDLHIRRAAVRYRHFSARGARLLAVGLAVGLVALLCALAYKRKLPRPASGRGAGRLTADRAIRSVGVAAAVLLVAGVVGVQLAWVPPPVLSQAGPVVVEPSKKEPPVDPAKQWPRFRGPGGLGISAFTNVPTEWDGKTGKNILWKKLVPLPGENSPIVWGRRVFLSGATKGKQAVYCYDAADGTLLWQRPVLNVPDSPKEVPEVFDMTGYAAPTMATDGQRAFAIFANGNLVAFDFRGKELWKQNWDTSDNMYGHAASLALAGDRLILQLDRGASGDDQLSSVAAVDAATGDPVWETTDRPVGNSWSSPIVIKTGAEQQVITCGAPWIIAYGPEGGVELWRAKCMSGDMGPSPVYAGGLVIACNEGADLVAIKPDGEGDVTKSHVRYKVGEGLPSTASPLSTKALTFLASGILVSCYDTQTGKLLWEHEDFEDSFNSSPSLVGDLVYVMDDKGTMHIFKAVRDKYTPVGTATLGEPSNTSPAFADGRIYIRGKKHLFCIGKADGGR